MGCGSCGKKNRLIRYKFVCLDCGETFIIDAASGIINESENYYIKANKILIKHGKCGSTKIRRT